MKTFLLSATALFSIVTAKAQTVTEDFNAATINSLIANCWILSGASITSQNGEAISGTSIYTAPATNANVKTDIYTPIYTISSANPNVSFDYRLTQALSGNAVRTIQVGLVNLSGNLIVSNTISLVAGTTTNIMQYSHTFSPVTPGNYRVVFRLSGSNGNGNVRIVLDNLATTGAALYSSSACFFTPIVESTLPVKLKYFTAELNNSKVDLKWVTVTELNASHFVIERSNNGTDFSDIAVIMAFGNTTEEKTYQFTDNTFSTNYPVVYYRLRQVDIDKKEDFSSTRIIRTGKQVQSAISILTYPNPVTNELRITVPANWQGKKVVYEIYQVTGQVAKRIEAASSSQTETVNLASLAPGFYIAKVTCDGQTAQQKIVKQ